MSEIVEIQSSQSGSQSNSLTTCSISYGLDIFLPLLICLSKVQSIQLKV